MSASKQNTRELLKITNLWSIANKAAKLVGTITLEAKDEFVRWNAFQIARDYTGLSPILVVRVSVGSYSREHGHDADMRELGSFDKAEDAILFIIRTYTESAITEAWNAEEMARGWYKTKGK